MSLSNCVDFSYNLNTYILYIAYIVFTGFSCLHLVLQFNFHSWTVWKGKFEILSVYMLYYILLSKKTPRKIRSFHTSP